MPGDPHTAVALRRILAIDGDTQVRVFLDPRAGFGQHRPSQDLPPGTACGPPAAARCTCAGPGRRTAARRRGGGLQAMITVPAGGHHDLVLEISDRPLEETARRPGPAWQATSAAWEQAVPKLSGTIADRDARHAYAVMRGLTSSGGGMAAAATMSLPERAEEGRNYDYRYAWIRDQCFSGQAVAAAGPYPLLDTAVGFVTERILADGPQLKPAYTVSGGPVPDERRLHLPGYPGGSDKVGNWVSKQFQLDAFGEALMLLAAAAAARPAGPRALAGRGSGRRRDQGTRRRSRRRDLGAGRAALGAFPADLRGRPAGRRPRWPRRARARPGAGSPTRCSPRSRPTACTRPAAGSGHPATTGSTPRCCCPPCAARCRPGIRAPWPPWRRREAELASDGYMYRYRPDERPLGDGRGRLPAVRLHHGAGPAPARPGGRGGPLVRAQPGRVRSSRPAHRGVRHHCSGRCAATRRRRSCTPCCSNRPSGWPAPWPAQARTALHRTAEVHANEH